MESGSELLKARNNPNWNIFNSLNTNALISTLSTVGLEYSNFHPILCKGLPLSDLHNSFPPISLYDPKQAFLLVGTLPKWYIRDLWA
jgi:hypothetical protein